MSDASMPGITDSALSPSASPAECSTLDSTAEMKDDTRLAGSVFSPSDSLAECSIVADSTTKMEDDAHLPGCEFEVPIPVKSHGQTANMVLLDSMLNHLAESKVAPFKSQQVGEPDLDFSQKREIAEDLLMLSPAQFLAKFGQYLLEDHLDYFVSPSDHSQNYEVDFHVKRLRRYLCKSKNKVDVRNRRFEALKKLIEEGEYFSDEEMMKRNPLMFEEMVGRFLTSEEKEILRRKESTKNDRSYVMHLMGQIEEHYVNCLKKKQMDDEYEEMDTSDEEEEQEESGEEEAQGSDVERTNDDIEEFDTDSETEDLGGKKDIPCQCAPKKRKVGWEEKSRLREEFINNMYETFLEGNDADFDYSKVDFNPEYDSTVLRGHDEEEKYFDSETPELVCSEEEGEDNAASTAASAVSAEKEEEEDELDKFMKSLEPDEALSKCIENVNPAENP